MSIDVGPELTQLGEALGLLQSGTDGWNLDFLADPERYLTAILSDTDQREALLRLLEAVLGTDAADLDLPAAPDGETWLPLVEQGAGGLYAVIAGSGTGPVRLTIAGRVGRSADGIDASASIRVPLLELGGDGPDPLVGGPDGAIAIGATLTGEDGPLVSEDGLTVGGLSVRASIATQPGADPPAALSVVVQGLAFAAGEPPEDLDLGELVTAIDAEAVRLLLAALRARVGDAPELGHLFALCGLGPSSSIPSFPLSDLLGAVDSGEVIIGWLRSLVADDSARAAWLGALAGLVGASVPVPGELCFVDTAAAAICLTTSSDADPGSGAPRVTVGLRARGNAPGDAATGALVADAQLLRVSMTTPMTVEGLPRLDALVRLTGAAGANLVDTPDADGHALVIGSLEAGLGLRPDRSLEPVLTARGVTLDTTEFQTLDLTDADAVMGALSATASDSLSNLLGTVTDLLDGSPRAQALAALLGLRAPTTGGWTPQLADPARLLVDPLRELCCYQTRVLAVPDAWPVLLGQLLVLIGPDGVAAPSVTGAGTAADPWRVPLATSSTAGTALLVWSRSNAAGGTVLLLGAEAGVGAELAPGATLAAHLRVELLAATLPAPDCTGPIGLDVAGCHSLAVTVGDDLTFDAGAITVQAEQVAVGVQWCRGGDPEPMARITGGRVVTGTGAVDLPDLQFDADTDFDLTALSGEAVMALGDLFGAWFCGEGTSWWRLGPLLGLIPGMPSVPGFSRADLPALIARLRDQTQWRGLLDAGGGRVTGAGTHADPWTVSTGSNDLPELLAWLDPDGPPTGAGRIPRGVLPPQLTEALDAGADALDPERLAELLRRAVSVAPEIAEVVDGDLGAALRLLRDQLAGTEGLVPADAQVVAGWQRVDLSPTTHLTEPIDLDLAADLPGLPVPARRVFVSAPLPWASPWTDADPAKVIDLREAGRDAATFTFDHVTGDGPWHVLLPSRADAVSAADPDGLAGLTARLLAAVRAVHDAVGGPVALIAHGTSGHAARQVAATPGLLTDVVTVGTPHATAPLGWLLDDGVRSAVRVLQRLRARTEAAGRALGPLAGVLDTVTAALDGIVTEQQGTDLVRRHVPFPIADYTAPAAPPALAAGVTGHCVVGALAPTAVDGALTDLVGRGVQALTQPPTGRDTPTHLGLGMRTRRSDGATTAGAVTVDGDVRADVHLVGFADGADHRAVPALRLHADLARAGGWLVAPPSTGLGERQDPRVRSMSIDIAVEFGEPAPAAATSAPRLQASITLHDVTVLGRWHERWVIDSSTAGSLADGVSGASGTLPEARMLLGMVAAALGDIPATGALRRLADLLLALDVAELDTGRLEFVTDGLTRLLVDPDLLLADLRAEAARLDAFLAALAGFGGGSRTADALVLTDSPDIEIAILGTLPDWTLRLRTLAPQTIAHGIALDASATVDGDGRVQGTLGLLSPVDLGPVGRPRLQVGLDTGATDPWSVAVALPEDALHTLPATVALLPTPDLPAAGRLAAAVLPGELLRHALTWAHDQAPAVVDPLLDVLGLLAPADAPLPVRSCAGLVSDPGGWLASTVALGAGGAVPRLAPARVQGLVDALAVLAGQAIAGGTLDLPGGATLRGDAAADGRAWLQVVLPAPTAGSGGAGGSIGVLLGDHLDLAPAVALDVRLGTVPGLDDAGVSVGVSGADPTLAISLTPTGAAAVTLPLLPAAGWGSITALADAAVGAAVQQVLPFVLDAAADEVDVVGTLGDALAVRTAGSFDGAKLQALANDPAARLREAAAVPSLLSALEALLDAVGVTTVTVATTTGSIAITPVPGLDLDVRLGSIPQLCVTVAEVEPVAGLAVGAEVCVAPTGVTGAACSVAVTDTALLGTDPVVLLPFLRLETGDRAPAGNRVLAGLWNAPPATTTRRALAAEVSLATLAAGVACLRADLAPEADTAGCTAEVALGVILPLVGDLVLAADEVQTLLAATLLNEAGLLGDALTAADVLDVVGGEYTLRAAVFSDLAGLPGRLLAIGLQLIEALSGAALGDTLGPLSITPVTLEDDGRKWYGLRLDLADALVLADGSDVGLGLDTYRGDFADSAERGIALYLVSHPSAADPTTPAGLAAIRCTPRLAIDEVGLRLTGPQQGTLLAEPIGVESVGLFGSYHGGVSVDGGGITGWDSVSGGIRLAVRRLSIPLGTGSDGGNPVAQKMLSQSSEAESAGDEEQLAAGFDLEIEVGSSGLQIHVGLGDPPWWIPVQRSFGPLYVDQFGLVVDDLDRRVETVGVLFDGGLELAGLAVGVDDLGVLYHIDTEQLELTLAGIGIAYSGGGLSLSGGLRRQGTDYLGMLQLQFSEYGLTAIGGWGEHPAGAPQSQRYTALFVFGVLTAPLGGPPPFFVTAIGAGFGINRRLVLPARVEDVPTYPLVDAMRSDSTLAQDPMAALHLLADTFPPHRGTFWFAAGVRFTSFVLVESVAVLGVEVGDGLEVGLLGLSRAVLPDPSVPMASVELALRARFSTREGVLAIQAQLTDNSWLISESCRLTGGFAFVVWFRTGQFVLTLGGYHPRFQRPADFPDVPRLGFHWSVSDAITIKGGLYFALTSSAIMVGGSLEASYRTSWAWASFEMGANALVMWDPFHYDFEVYIRVSAGVRIRVCVPLLGCATIGFSFSIGARVHIEGPEFRGTAELDLDVVSITVRFGGGNSSADSSLDWEEFRPRYLTDGDRSTGLEMALGEGRYVDAGAPASDAEDAVDGPWQVLPEFVVLMTTTVASTHFNGSKVGGLDQIDIGPMRVADTETDLTVTLHRGGPTGTVIATSAQIRIERRTGTLPEAVWRTYPSSGEAPASADLVTAVTGARLTVEARVLDSTGNIPIEQVDVGELVHPLPLRQQVRWRGLLERHRANAEALLAWAGDRGAGPAVAHLFAEGRLTAVGSDTGTGRWRLALDPALMERPVTAPADAALLGERADALVSGAVPAQARIARSVPLAGRAAPPRVRSLAGGMRRDTAQPVAVAAAPDPVQPTRPAPRLAPRLEAVLHEVVAPRDAAPSTAAGRVGEGLPRVAPPSLPASVELALRIAGADLHTVAPPVTDEVGVRAGSRAITGIAGERHEWRAADGRLAPSRLRALRRLEQDVAGDGVELPCGRVQVWQVPDSSRDDRTHRPKVAVRGDAPVRVVALDRAGRVLADTTGEAGETVLPRGTSRVALAGVAGGVSGLAGWHAGTRLARISAHTLLAPGAVVRSEAASSRRGGRTATTGLVGAADVVPRRGTVATTLPSTTRTVVIGLEPLGEAATPEGFALRLSGAARTGAAPLVVRAGERVYGVFRVAAETDAERLIAEVDTDEQWHLAAVVGSPDDIGVVATWLADGGLEHALPGLASATGGTARVRWLEPQGRDDG